MTTPPGQAPAIVAVVATDALLRIGELARVSGSNPRTLRFYESVGLLPAAKRSPANYRLYDGRTTERLQFIRKARGLGMSLAEIRSILAVEDAGAVPCDHVIGTIDGRLQSLADQMERLASLRADLANLRQRLLTALAEHPVEPGQPCPCIIAIARGTPGEAGSASGLSLSEGSSQ